MMLLALACSPRGEPQPRPSVLVVVLDTVRADATGVGGASPEATPALDALGARGLVFEDATAPGSWTWPSHASLFTGLYPWQHQAHAGEGLPLRESLQVTALRQDVPTLAERFAAAGYRTRAMVGNRLLAAPLGLTRGFQEVEVFQRDDLVIDAAVADLGPDELLFVNLMRAHSPYQLAASTTRLHGQLESPELAAYRVEGGFSLFATEPSLLERNHTEPVSSEALGLLRALYDGEVTEVDAQLGRLLAAWWAAHPDGIVAVTSDHGELFGEHGQLDHGSHLWPELTHVPLVLAGNGVPTGRRTDPVQMHDLYPTLLGLAGLTRPEWTLVDGEPRPEPVQAGAWARPHLAESLGGSYASDWALLREGSHVVLVGAETQLYDLSRDPGMTLDMAPERPELASRLSAKAPSLSTEGLTVEVEPSEIEALRALGYVE